MPNLSIIMPVYNGEKFLDKSINSILNQTYKDFNLIIVDDCSTDKSIEICNKYKKKDNRILIFVSEKNMGNLPLNFNLFKEYLSKFVMCVDQDDWLETNAAEILIQSISETNADIVICDYFINECELSNSNISPAILDNKNAMYQLILDKEIKSYFWNKIYTKNIFINGMKNTFNDRDIFDDFVQMPYIFKNAQKIVLIDKTLYHYYVNPFSYSLSTKKSILHYHLAKSYWYRLSFLDKFYPELLLKTPILNKAFSISLGTWKELKKENNNKMAYELQKYIKINKNKLKQTDISLMKKIIIKILTIK